MISTASGLLALVQAVCGTTGASPAPAPQHFVFVRREHARLSDTSFLNNRAIAGAQVTYTWRELEPLKDNYALDSVRSHLALLRRHGKRLFLQLQDVSFSERVLTPDYLRSDTAYHGGVARKYEGGNGEALRFDGWVARRWDPSVRERMAKLFQALAREFDGAIEGVVLPETAIGFSDSSSFPSGFSYESYAVGVRENLSAARAAFTRSCVIIYANFMPGDWLPTRDHGYLRGVYAHAAAIGAGVGGPDILPFRPGQMGNSIPLIAARPPGVVAGMAVQDGNLMEKNPTTGRAISVSELYLFAVQRLHLDYIFWGTEEPFYTSDILPFLRDRR